MNTELALKVNKYIHEQCIGGVPHDIGWNVVKLFLIPPVSGSLGFDEGYAKGYTDASREAQQEIREHYHPNDR